MGIPDSRQLITDDLDWASRVIGIVSRKECRLKAPDSNQQPSALTSKSSSKLSNKPASTSKLPAPSSKLPTPSSKLPASTSKPLGNLALTILSSTSSTKPLVLSSAIFPNTWNSAGERDPTVNLYLKHAATGPPPDMRSPIRQRLGDKLTVQANVVHINNACNIWEHHAMIVNLEVNN